MLVFYILHSVLDAGLMVGVLFVLRSLRELKALYLTPRPRRPRTEDTSAPVMVEIWKGDFCIGARPEGHPDLAEAENNPALSIRKKES